MMAGDGGTALEYNQLHTLFINCPHTDLETATHVLTLLFKRVVHTS